MYEKQIVYDPITKDFAYYLNNELCGFARSYADAENELDKIIYKRLKKGN